MFKLLKYFYFSSYWIAYDLGEKKTPQINAEYITSVLISLNILSILKILKFYGFKIYSWYVIVSSVFCYLSIYLLFTHNKKYNKYVNEYLFLNDNKNKAGRNIKFICLIVWTLLFLAFSILFNDLIMK